MLGHAAYLPKDFFSEKLVSKNTLLCSPSYSVEAFRKVGLLQSSSCAPLFAAKLYRAGSRIWSSSHQHAGLAGRVLCQPSQGTHPRSGLQSCLPSESLGSSILIDIYRTRIRDLRLGHKVSPIFDSTLSFEHRSLRAFGTIKI